MNTKVSAASTLYQRLVTIGVGATLVDAAKLLSNTQSLVVVCGPDGAMAGVITKTDIARQIGHCGGSACTRAAADVMPLIRLLQPDRLPAQCRGTDAQSQLHTQSPSLMPNSNRSESLMRAMRCGSCWRKKNTSVLATGLRDGYRLPVRMCP